MTETVLKKYDKLPPIELPRSVKHATSRSNTWSLSDHTGRLIEHEVLDQLREPYSRDAKEELEAICAESQVTMRELFPQLSKLKEIQSKLEVAYLYHWHRKTHADRLLAKMNGKERIVTVKKGGKVVDPEAAYIAKFEAASKEERARMIATLKREV